MYGAAVAVSLFLALVMTGSAGGKLVRAAPVVDNLSRAGVPDRWYPPLAVVDVVGAVGLVAGLWWAPAGVAAAAGFVGYFATAVAMHLRRGDTRVVPPTVLGLTAVAALALWLAS